MARPALMLEEHRDGVLAGDRVALGRALTLVESQRAEDQRLAQALLVALQPHTGGAYRVGVTGVPGVGKSTFIDALGFELVEAGHRVAVLAVDPSSRLSGGSILGDKTRMARLAVHERAFVRPSPSSGSLGGVAHKTREAMLVCEAAGYDVLLVETVGVGQSETLVADMVDFFLFLALAGAGDELQGVKRGILEMAELVAVNKADGDNLPAARRARKELAMALHLLRPRSVHWTPPVLTCSALTGEGLDEIWAHVEEHRRRLEASGERAARRAAQLVRWTWALVEEGLRRRVEESQAAVHLEQELAAGIVTPTLAAARILAELGLESE